MWAGFWQLRHSDRLLGKTPIFLLLLRAGSLEYRPSFDYYLFFYSFFWNFDARLLKIFHTKIAQYLLRLHIMIKLVIEILVYYHISICILGDNNFIINIFEDSRMFKIMNARDMGIFTRI